MTAESESKDILYKFISFSDTHFQRLVCRALTKSMIVKDNFGFIELSKYEWIII